MNGSHPSRLFAIGLLASPIALLLAGDGAAVPILSPQTVTFEVDFSYGEPPVPLTMNPLTLEAVGTNDSTFIDETVCVSLCNPPLIVENNGEYSFAVRGRITDLSLPINNNAFDPMNLSMGTPEPYDVISRDITVERTQTHVIDNPDHTEGFRYSTALISGRVNVDGGRLRRLELWATYEMEVDGAQELYTAYYDELNDFSPDAETAREDILSTEGSAHSFVEDFEFPMIVGSDITLIGVAHLETDSGIQVSRILGGLDVDLSDGEDVTAPPWPVIDLDDLASPGTISGDIAASFLPGGPSSRIAQYHFARVTGVPDTPTEGASDSDLVFGDRGSYSLPNLLPGEYSLTAESYFTAPSGFLRRPIITTAVVSDSITTHNIGDDSLGHIQVPVVMNGFYSLGDAEVSYVRVYADGVGDTGGAVARSDISGSEANVPVTMTDSWVPNRYEAHFSQNGVNASISGTDGTRPSVNLAVDGPAGVYTVPSFTMETTRTAITFDVLEGGGPEALLRDAQLIGTFDDGVSIRTFQAYGASGAANASATPRVEIVAEPGEYTVHAAATVMEGLEGTLVVWPEFTFTVATPTVPSNDGIVDLPEARIDFDGSVGDGLVSVTSSPIGPAVPDGLRYYQLEGDTTPVYYEVFTNIELPPDTPAEVCIYYDPGLSQALVNGLTLLHHDPDEGMGECANTPPGYPRGDGWCEMFAIPDTANNRICGLVTSFSPFLLTLPIDDDGDGIEIEDDNCPSDANADQLDADGDGVGDACDDDGDNDGLSDGEDNCPTAANADQADLDADGVGDLCDPDDDGDGVEDDADNCPYDANADQLDTDGDGPGDACDPCGDACLDEDGDGVPNGQDNCMYDANADQLDTDGDGIGDVCDECPLSGDDDHVCGECDDKPK